MTMRQKHRATDLGKYVSKKAGRRFPPAGIGALLHLAEPIESRQAY
jgi:hypothetical protein